MEAASILLILAAAGVNYGWQPADDSTDGYEYVVQIEPELLDVLQGGEAVPIESSVPDHVAPIRKVSIIVGRGDVPRSPRLSQDAVNHTAYFAGQAGWSPGSTSQPPGSAPTYDRYSQPPAIADRTRSAISETGNTLRDGFEAGVQAANQQVQGWANGAGQQLQTTGNSLRSAAEQTLGVSASAAPASTNPFGTPATSAPAANSRPRSSVTPPPWNNPTGEPAAPSGNFDDSATETATAQAPLQRYAPKRTDSGWTSIGTQVAAPPILVPRLTTSTDLTPLRASTATSGPALTPPALVREPARNVGADSSSQTSPASSAADSWAVDWNNTDSASDSSLSAPASISRNVGTGARYSDDRSEVTQQPANSGEQNSQQQAANSWADVWGDRDPWDQPAQQAQPPHQAPPATPAPQTASNTGSPAGNSNSPPLLGPPANQVGQQPAASANAPLVATPTAPSAKGSLASTSGEEPWLPLLIVSVTLAGSLGANLFLGWSYMDARQKYRSLVRKTADKFRRATAAA